jgi:2'-5' RNA ligase
MTGPKPAGASGGGARRLYFALWPDAALRSTITAATLPALTGPERIVPAGELHVTLAFLGAVAVDRVSAAVEAARKVSCEGGVQRFDRLARWGARGPVVLEPMSVEDSLRALHAELHSLLSAAEFALDRREFRPHITLSRGPDRRARGLQRSPLPSSSASPTASPIDVSADGRADERVDPPIDVPAIDWPFASFVLVESIGRPVSRSVSRQASPQASRPAGQASKPDPLAGRGERYSVIATFPLRPARNWM